MTFRTVEQNLNQIGVQVTSEYRSPRFGQRGLPLYRIRYELFPNGYVTCTSLEEVSRWTEVIRHAQSLQPQPQDTAELLLM